MSKMHRHIARGAVVQAIYSWQLTDNDYNDLVNDFLEELNNAKADTEFFLTTLRGVLNKKGDIENKLLPYVNKSLDEIGPIERAVLRLGVYELFFATEKLPPKVILNEAIELTKEFGGQDSYKFVNRILDKVISAQ